MDFRENMASPTKKRKMNSDSSSPRATRNLDYFFSKEKKSALLGRETKEQRLTDEELARRLHEQWNKGDTQLETRHNNPLDTLPAKGNTVKSEEYISREDTGPGPPVPSLAPEAPRKTNLALQSVSSAEDAISSTIPLDEDALNFIPSEYVPELQEHWKSEGGDSSYALLTRCFVLVNGTRSRIKIVNTLVNFLSVIIEGDPGSLLSSVWLATNAISPPYESLELGLGGSAISKALKNACGLDNQSLKAIYNKYGDAGDVAFEAKKKQSFTLRKPKPLSIKSVYQSLVKIANTKGPGSQEAKQRIVERLLQDARGGEESRYIVRTLVQHVTPKSSSVPYSLVDFE
ncbi:hypothetical protein GP486_000227 [Trichoglossum hirsutum]|uniref:DNA ligase ATP-dependent N-terminal domain-containing protein n=1 Tax=Trichoglossum hirsutum TaxID=265104 RepID=A0A9P8LJ28_9PEZI|nr:hypothetical protein GP486_000227 [Trichoglossum hirsutum]